MPLPIKVRNRLAPINLKTLYEAGAGGGVAVLLAYFCNIPGSAPAIAPVMDGGKPNLVVRLFTNPPSIALVTAPPPATLLSIFDSIPPNIPPPSEGCAVAPFVR